MRCRALAFASGLALLAACKKEGAQPGPEATAAAAAAQPALAPGEVEAPDPLAPRASDPGFDVVAEGVQIDTVTPGVVWLGPDATREILFVLAADAWRLQPVEGGVALHVGAASRLAARIGLREGDVVSRVNELEVRGVADARAVMTAFAAGERVRVGVRRDGELREIFVRVVEPGGAPARTRVDDIVAAGLHDAPEPAIERALLVGLGAAKIELAGRPELVLQLLGLPGDAADVSLAGASVAREDLARALGSAAGGDRLELTAGGVTVSRKIVSGAVEASDLEQAILRLPSEGRARSPVLGDVPGDPASPFPEAFEAEPEVEGLERLDEGHVRITRELVETWLGDPSTLAKAARIVPGMKDGAIHGFKLYGIRRGSPVKALGFRNGDMVTAINGHALTDVEAAMGVYAKVRKAKKVSVAFERKGSAMTMEIDVVE